MISSPKAVGADEAAMDAHIYSILKRFEFNRGTKEKEASNDCCQQDMHDVMQQDDISVVGFHRYPNNPRGENTQREPEC